MIKYTVIFLALIFLLYSSNALALLLSTEEQYNISTSNAFQNPSVDRYIEGINAMLKNDTAAAERRFTESINLDSSFSLPLIGLADIALRNQRKKEALTWLDKAVKVDPDNPQVYHALGRFYYLDRNPAKAETAFKKAISIDPKNLSAILDLADFYVNSQGNLDKAITVYRSALSINPNHAGAQHGFGMALAMKGEMLQAVTELHKASELAPHNPLPRQAIGRIYLSQGQMDKALHEFNEALRIEKDFVPALIDKGDIYLNQGNFKRALAEFQYTVKIAPLNDLVHLKLGMALQGLNRIPESEKAYLAALQLNPNHIIAYNNLAWMAAEKRKNLIQAEKWAKKAIEQAPEIPSFHDTLAWVYRAQGKLEEAEKTLSKAVKMNPQSAEIHYHLGQIYLDQKKIENAKTAFQTALKLDSNYFPALQALRKIEE
ncbi:Tfp pilus assembly protein PilF [Nitrosomonas nitrosa]|uniref:Tfp pilus assembly protein PilF n=1 Tax=Nitrosomonas nitrosa TaxID=52442 RepID=A0A1I4TZK3_9PROT|nr:tetratricopeptide repeat protein [Nitrosomonas nitrosa]SFM82194.1 Tfp pilus assembly protein PilF [Nitrosomonas nitrosa]